MKARHLFVLLLLVVFYGKTFAYDVSLTINATSVSSGGVTVTCSKAEGSSAPAVQSSSYVRLYANNTVRIYCADKKIVGLHIGWSKNTSKTYATATASSGTYSDPASDGSSIVYGEWTGSSNTIIFTIGTGQKQIHTIDVTFESSSSSTETCATPTFSLSATSTYPSAQSTTISCATAGATIYYTTDGTIPTTSSSVYSSAIPIPSSMTIKAIAVKDGYNNSAVAEASYTILICSTPTFSPAAGTYEGTQSVSILDEEGQAYSSSYDVYYTTDGSTPTTSSNLYSGAISVSSSCTIKAIATRTDYGNSAVATATYVITAIQGDVYDLITSTAGLSEGDEVIIVNKDAAVAAGPVSNDYLTAVSVDLAADYSTAIVRSGSTAVVFDLGKTTGAWTFSSSTGLLGTTAAKKANLSGNGTTTWSIKITSGTAVIESTTSDYGKLCYNTSSPRFATYASVIGDVRLYKKRNSSPAVIYNANGATGGMAPAKTEFTAGTPFTLATNSGSLVKTGHSFNGWNTAADGTGTHYAAGASVTLSAKITLYAEWTANSYNVTFDKNNASATGTMANQSITFGQSAALTANAFSRDGYDFTGWATSASGTKTYDDQASYTMSSEGVTLYAVWTAQPVKHTVTFYVNGESYSSSEVEENASFDKPSTDPTPCSGYTFVGWALAEQYDETTDKPTIATFPWTMKTSNQSYYALFSRTEVNSGSSTITLNGANLSEVIDGISYASTDFEYEGLAFKRTNVLVNSSVIQIKANTSNCLYNSDPIPGVITQIVVTGETNASTLTVGTSAKPTTNSTSCPASPATTVSYPASSNYKYFKIAATASYTRIESIVITYSGGSTTYYTTGCGVYPITAVLTNVDASDENPTTVAVDADDLMLSYSAPTGYNLPDAITVTMGGATLSSTTDYVWDKTTGDLLIDPTSGFSGAIVVTIAAQPKQTIITIDANTANHGATTPGTITATYGQALPSFTAATGESGYKLSGYYTDPTAGERILNASGSIYASATGYGSNNKWIYEGATLTLYPRYNQITNMDVTWYVNGEEYTAGNPSISVSTGERVTTLPTDPESCDATSTTFVGWTTTPILTKQNTPPTLLFTTAAASPAVSENTSFYAVFAQYVTDASSYVDYTTTCENINPAVEIVSWAEDAIYVDIDVNGTPVASVQQQVTTGDAGTLAEDIFFTKYFEASGFTKLVGIYNGTNHSIDISDLRIRAGKTSWPTSSTSTNYVELSTITKLKTDYGSGSQILLPAGTEIILYSMSPSNEDGYSGAGCLDDYYSWDDLIDNKVSNWYRIGQYKASGDGYSVTAYDGNKVFDFSGPNSVSLERKVGSTWTLIDIIGAGTISSPVDTATIQKTGQQTLGNGRVIGKPNDAKGFFCADGMSPAAPGYPNGYSTYLSTNRCLLIRKSSVVSGANAVSSNKTTFATLCTEWLGIAIGNDGEAADRDCASGANFGYVGSFDYKEYYTSYVEMTGVDFDVNSRQADGTYKIDIDGLSSLSCSPLKVIIYSDAEKTNKVAETTQQVPIMISGAKTTASNTAPWNTDGKTATVCNTCDVVVLSDGTLTHNGNSGDIDKVRNLKVYQGGKLVLPSGKSFKVTTLSFRREKDEVATADLKGTLTFAQSKNPVYADIRIDANRWYWFTLPYDCNVADVKFSDGTTATYGVDWYLKTYDGAGRAATQTGGKWTMFSGETIKAGVGYILAIEGKSNSNYEQELRFPMTSDVIAAEKTDKQVNVASYGFAESITPNHKGWNLVGNPYINYYTSMPETGLSLGRLVQNGTTHDWEWDGSVPYVTIPQGGGYSEYSQQLVSGTQLPPFTSYFVQVGVTGDASGAARTVNFAAASTKNPIVARRMPEVENTAPIYVSLQLSNEAGEQDETTIVAGPDFSADYEIGGDLYKWMGSYYNRYTKPVLYSRYSGGDLAFQSLTDSLAAQPTQLGYYAAQQGTYTISLRTESRDLSQVSAVWLYDAVTEQYTNLMTDDYSFTSARQACNNARFTVSVTIQRRRVATDAEQLAATAAFATGGKGIITVSRLTDDARVYIYDAAGRLVLSEHAAHPTRTYAVPQAGVYMVRILSAQGNQVLRAIAE